MNKNINKCENLDNPEKEEEENMPQVEGYTRCSLKDKSGKCKKRTKVKSYKRRKPKKSRSYSKRIRR